MEQTSYQTSEETGPSPRPDQGQTSTATPNLMAAEKLFVIANSGQTLQPPVVPLNRNRMLVPPVQALGAEKMVERIVQSVKDAMRVDAPCGKKVCHCG